MQLIWLKVVIVIQWMTQIIMSICIPFWLNMENTLTDMIESRDSYSVDDTSYNVHLYSILTQHGKHVALQELNELLRFEQN